MKIIPIPALEDNYSYILIDEKTKEAAVIDPVEPIKILNVISQTGAKLSRYNIIFLYINTLYNNFFFKKKIAYLLHIIIGITQVETLN